MYTAAVFWRGFSVFFVAIIDTFGWSRGATSAALSLQRLEGGAISPFVGTAIEKFGRRRVMAFGVVTTGLAFILMSLVQELWQFYLTVVLLTVGMSFGTFIILVSTVSNWFIKQRTRALAVLMSATAIGGLALPFLQQAVEGIGWREVLFGAGVGFWLIGIPAAFLMRNRPEDYGMMPDGEGGSVRSKTASGLRHSVRDDSAGLMTALRTRVFWQMALAASLAQMASASNLVHIDALKSFDVNVTFAAGAVGFVAIGDLLGRASLAVVGDRFDRRRFLAVAFVLEALGIGALALVNWSSLGISPLFVYVAGFGLGFGASIPLRLSLVGDYFGRRNYASIVGLISAVNALFQAAGAAFPGFVFDVTQDYRLPLLILAGGTVFAAPLSFFMEPVSRTKARIRAMQISKMRREVSS